MFIKGETAAAFDEYSSDAGAGYTWSDWVESRADDIMRASAPVARQLLSEFIDPAGYISGMPDDIEERTRQFETAITAARARLR